VGVCLSVTPVATTQRGRAAPRQLELGANRQLKMDWIIYIYTHTHTHTCYMTYDTPVLHVTCYIHHTSQHRTLTHLLLYQLLPPSSLVTTATSLAAASTPTSPTARTKNRGLNV
jgi:hypothetical protein